MAEGDSFLQEPLPEEPGYYYGNLIPFRENLQTGARELAWPEAIRGPVNTAARLFQTPGAVAAGQLDPQSAARSAAADWASLTVNPLARMGSPAIMAGPQGAFRAAWNSVRGNPANGRAFSLLDTADKAVAQGADPDMVRQATGWYKNLDNRWRFELNDKDSQVGNLPPDNMAVPLGSVLQHSSLYDFYPELKDYGLMFKDLPNNINGSHFPGQGIILNSRFLNQTKTSFPAMNWEEAPGGAMEDLRSTLLHEVQHAVQHIEGFAHGGNPEQFRIPTHDEQSPYRDQFESSINNVLNTMGLSKDPNKYSDQQIAMIHKAAQWDMYQRMLGEAEARGVQLRRNMSPSSRQRIDPLLTQQSGMNLGTIHTLNPQGDSLVLTPIDGDPFQ